MTLGKKAVVWHDHTCHIPPVTNYSCLCSASMHLPSWPFKRRCILIRKSNWCSNMQTTPSAPSSLLTLLPRCGEQRTVCNISCNGDRSEEHTSELQSPDH